MKLRAIIIDDDENCRKLLAKVLERESYEVFSFPDPCACPLYMNPTCICPHEHACGDFLITDNKMPRMSRLEFVEHQSRRGCKGIVKNKAVISGTWSAAELLKAEQLECKTFRKPYNLNLLLEWISEREKQIPVARELTRFDDL